MKLKGYKARKENSILRPNPTMTPSIMLISKLILNIGAPAAWII